MTDLEILIGKVITSVTVSDDFIMFVTSDVEADCCSQTWIYDVEGIDNLINSAVANIVEHPVGEYDYADEPKAVGHTKKYDCLQVYTYDIVTKKGICTIDFRND